MNSKEPDSDQVEPIWFRTWREREEKRRSGRELSEGGFSIFAIGLGGIAVALGLAALEDVNSVAVAQVLLISMFAMIVGVVIAAAGLLGRGRKRGTK